MKINKKNYDLSSTVKIIDIETGKTSNKQEISVTLFVFHLEISGKDDNDSHQENR